MKLIISLSVLVALTFLSGCSSFWQDQRARAPISERYPTSECYSIGSHVRRDCAQVARETKRLDPEKDIVVKEH